jgi:hypothetical protein
MSFYCDDVPTRIKRQLVLGAMLAALGLVVGATISPLSALLVGYAFFGIPFGWPALARVIRQQFVARDIVGLTMYWSILLTASGFVGMVVAPVDLYKLFTIWKAGRDAAANEGVPR